MDIRSLQQTNVPELVDCLLEAFAGYFVPMPKEVRYWENRFKGARVRFDLSFGAFEGDRLVAFIINGVDQWNGQLTAFNTGTGVIPDFRSRQLVDQLYHFAFPHFKKAGVQTCVLEVIQQNDRAIRVYERIGFKKNRKLKCFKGVLKEAPSSVQVSQVDFQRIMTQANPDHKFYSWDNVNSAILAQPNVFDSYLVQTSDQEPIGHFTIKSGASYLAQFEAKPAHWKLLFEGIQSIQPKLSINNVDQRRSSLIEQLEAAGLVNHIDQFEMEMSL